MNKSIASSWKTAFRNGFEERYIKLVVDSYKEVKKSSKGVENPWENTRRNMLCSQMQKDKGKYGITFNIAPERGVWDEQFKDKGRIDICCYLSELDDQYIAFECKRFLKKDLCPSYINSEYYGQGIRRFEENVYSQNVNVGGMIAFLEEGDYSKLGQVMLEELPAYSAGNAIEDASESYEHDYVYKTVHFRKNNDNIKLVHILMDFAR